MTGETSCRARFGQERESGKAEHQRVHSLPPASVRNGCGCSGVLRATRRPLRTGSLLRGGSPHSARFELDELESLAFTEVFQDEPDTEAVALALGGLADG